MSVADAESEADQTPPSPKALPFAETGAAAATTSLTDLQARFNDLRRAAVAAFLWENVFLVATLVLAFIPHRTASLGAFFASMAALGGALCMTCVHIHGARWADRHTLPAQSPAGRGTSALAERITLFLLDGLFVLGLVVVMAVVVPAMEGQGGRLLAVPRGEPNWPTLGVMGLAVVGLMAWIGHLGTVIALRNDVWCRGGLLRRLALEGLAARLLAVEAKLEPLDRRYARWSSPEVADALDQFSTARSVAADRLDKDFAAVEADLDAIDSDVRAGAERLVLDPDAGAPRKLIALSRLREIVRYDRARLAGLRAWCGPPSKSVALPSADPPRPFPPKTP